MCVAQEVEEEGEEDGRMMRFAAAWVSETSDFLNRMSLLSELFAVVVVVVVLLLFKLLFVWIPILKKNIR